MSSQPSAPAPSISKSAARKRAKKAAASARTQPPSTASATAEVRVDLGDAVDPNDPNLYLPPGDYPVDLEYEHEQFYDETEFPTGHPDHHQQSIPLPFIDYSLSPYQTHQHPFANLPPSVNITNEDLIQTANELYRRMADPKFASDDAYWSSLPAHIRNFIREAVPFSPGDAQANGTSGRDESIHSLAQRIVTVASQGMGLNNVGASLMNGGMPAQRSTQPPPQQPGLARELGFHPHPDAREEDDYEDEDLDQEADLALAAANGDAPKKKNKKKKKKSANPDPALVAAPPPPIPAVKQSQTMPPHPQQQPVPRPAFHPPPPPTTAAPNGSTPSPRAIGKQPMATNPAAAPPSRSAKGKAPATNGAAHPPAHNHPPAAKSANAKGKAPANAPPAKIWTQSSAQDRENINAFWLSLSDAERRDLVQIEKDSVIKKIKEQHRHACGCAVCGRKKVNIEMELDSLYEQYYEELRVYAAEQKAAVNGRQAAPPGAGPFPGSVEVDATGQIIKFDHRAPEPMPPEDEDEYGSEEVIEDEDYEGEEEDDEELGSEDAEAGDEADEPPPAPRQAAKAPAAPAAAPRPENSSDFAAFGAGLTTIKACLVPSPDSTLSPLPASDIPSTLPPTPNLRFKPGGVLTVADDLLKNDGAKFLEMMEQLAVVRVRREEQNTRDMQADTDEEDYDEKEEHISDLDRAEEGNRMFQIFAARMFEARILTAYRERVAKQREEQLLRELEEEEDSKRAKEEKKAKEAQKKKDKKKQQKERADAEKASRDAALAEEQRIAKEKAAELERERQKKAEEERLRREAVKKAAAEEAARKDAERKKRQQEERERDEEAKRKRQEATDKARREKEAREKEIKEKERKDREEKAARDKAEKERIAKEKAEKDRLVKEKAEKDRLAKLKEEEEKAKREEAARKERQERQAAEHARHAAQREKEAKEREAAVERAAHEKAMAAANKAAQDKARSSQPIPIRPGSTSHGPIPLPINQPSPIKANASASTSMHRGQSGPLLSAGNSKTSTPAFMSQPIPPMTYQGPRITSNSQNLAPGSFRSGFPSVSPVYTSNGGPSPAPPSRSFPEPASSPFDIRSAPIGMGFPQQKTRPAPIGSMDELSPTHLGPRVLSGGSNDLPSQLGSLSLMSEPSSSAGPQHTSYHPAPGPAPIGPPKSIPQPIGRPSYYDSHTAPLSNRPRSPVKPDQVLGSAALGSDDDVVVPQPRRNTSSTWDVPASAPGMSNRWSAAPVAASSIWNPGPSDIPPLSQTHNGQSHWNQTYLPPSSGPQARQPSFSGLGGGPFGSGPGNGPFGSGLNLFSTPHPTNSHNHHPNSNANNQHH